MINFDYSLGGVFIKIKKVIIGFFILNFILITRIYALSPQNSLEYEGIDVSNWQKNIDYAKVKNAGIKIVYIKASEGTTFIDPYLEKNYANAKANNLMIGFYHFLTARTVSQAEAQASFFASVIEGKEVDCKLAMDYEQFYGVSTDEINQIAVAFLRKLKQITKKDVIVYSNLNNLRNTFNKSVSNEGNLWLAYYNNINNLIGVNSAWDTYIGIQYTSSGSIPGIQGNVDRDRFSKEIFMESTDPNEIESGSGNDKSKIINYIVKPGDTLSKIAYKYGTTVDEIAKLNNIQNVNLIYPGQCLEIITNSINQITGMNQTIYTVRKGDTLTKISVKFGVSVQNLVAWNNIKNPNLIYAGNTLIIYKNSNNEINSNLTYTVKKGDTLWAIGKRYGINYKRIAYVNGIKNPRWIYPGQVLKIY